MSNFNNTYGKYIDPINSFYIRVFFNALTYLVPDPPQQTVGLGEFANQTAKEAVPRAIVWGRFRPIGGNLIHVQSPQTKWIKTTTTVNTGKGGKKKKKQVTKTKHVYRTYAIGVCEGPISKFIRIWRNGQLVYDARGNAWGTENNQVFLNKARLYTGSWTQNADPTLQSIWGASNVPAYRGTAYIVMINEDLTDLGGAVPQFQFEVERAEGIYYTSRPYAIGDLEAMEATGVPDIHIPPTPFVTETMQADGISVVAGELRQTLVTYDEYPAEAIDANGISAISGTLRNLLVTYDEYPAEAIDANGISAISGTFKETLITYDNYPAEAIDANGISAITGSLAIP